MAVAVVEAALRVGDADHRPRQHLAGIAHALRERAAQVEREAGVAVVGEAPGEALLGFFAHRCRKSIKLDSTWRDGRDTLGAMKLAILPGDGIGPETTAATLRVLEVANRKFALGIETEIHP